ncbi:RNA polymerase sigma-70 factor [Fibrisoma montanum]|uniref:RNA polymerase sigma-70 factor n=1 Tax=Fibrisoma montanum TaxID=2305895 RepID=A0A418M4U1_9BACT|nr:RNA polymerase sigma-70 factor [Fibrisoma montanum]RIV20683.1 RNA polymerase sigma-70 factor [Fibrisoma montanum]
MSANTFPFRPPGEGTPLSSPLAESSVPGMYDQDLFIRKTFEQDARQGCEQLFRLYFAPLCSHAVRFVYNRQVAEDLVADLFYQFYADRQYERVTGSYRAYLYQAIRNRAFNYIRWELGRQGADEPDPDRPDLESGQPDQLLLQDELYQTLERAVQGLSPQRQRVFIMSRFDGKSYKEIAGELDLSPKTVENHLLRALSTVRAALRRSNLLSLVVGILLTTLR